MMTSSNGNLFSATGFCAGNDRSPVNSPHKIQWRGALTFSVICAWINGWVNNRWAGDLRRHHAHYNVTVMSTFLLLPHYLYDSLTRAHSWQINSSAPGQNGLHFADGIFRCIRLNEKFCNFIKISLQFVPKGPVDNNPALVYIMTWHQKDDRQAIIWTNADPIHWRIYVRGDVLTVFL